MNVRRFDMLLPLCRVVPNYILRRREAYYGPLLVYYSYRLYESGQVSSRFAEDWQELEDNTIFAEEDIRIRHMIAQTSSTPSVLPAIEFTFDPNQDLNKEQDQRNANNHQRSRDSVSGQEIRASFTVTEIFCA